MSWFHSKSILHTASCIQSFSLTLAQKHPQIYPISLQLEVNSSYSVTSQSMISVPHIRYESFLPCDTCLYVLFPTLDRLGTKPDSSPIPHRLCKLKGGIGREQSVCTGSNWDRMEIHKEAARRIFM